MTALSTAAAVLITRPQEDALPLAAQLQQRGWTVFIDPVLKIEFLKPDYIDLSDVCALLFTSANGVRAFSNLTPLRHFPVYAVGDATADAAIRAGFNKVFSAQRNSKDLIRLVIKTFHPQKGVLFYGSGTHTAQDITGQLQRVGFQIRQQALYMAQPSSALLPATLKALQEKRINTILFFSARTATIFIDLIRAGGQVPAEKCFRALCLSAVIAQAASREDQLWYEILVAAAPTQAALIDLL